MSTTTSLTTPVQVAFLAGDGSLAGTVHVGLDPKGDVQFRLGTDRVVVRRDELEAAIEITHQRREQSSWWTNLRSSPMETIDGDKGQVHVIAPKPGYTTLDLPIILHVSFNANWVIAQPAHEEDIRARLRVSTDTLLEAIAWSERRQQQDQ